MSNHGSITHFADIHQPFTWVQDADPTIANAADVANGQFWLDTNASPLTLYYRQAGAWVVVGSTAAGLTEEQVEDAVAAMFAAGSHTGITVTYDDPTDSLDLAVTSGGEIAYLTTAQRLVHVMKTPASSSTAMNGVGLANASVTGAVVSADDDDGPWNSIRTSTTDNNNASASDTSGTSAQFRQAWLPDMMFLVKTEGTVTDIAYYVGVVSSTSMARANSEIGAYFTYDTDTAETAFWRCFSANNTGAQELTATSVAIAADTIYRLRIKLLNTNVEFYINDVLVATHTTRVPSASQALGWRVHCTTRTTAARGLKFGRLTAKMKG